MWGQWTYLFLELGWAGPVILLQWLVGWPALVRRWRVWLPGVLLPTLYLTFVDSFALRSGTWSISPHYSTGFLLPLGVPIEELIFFLITNTLVVQGLLLLTDAQTRQRGRRWSQAARTRLRL